MTDIDTYTRVEIENGRLFFAGEWRFLGAANSPASIPPMHGIEIAFAGRSNVGKSSLINALTGRKALARTSRTPGRTQELIFFGSNAGLTLVDMPGYGYAAVAKSTIKAWTELIHAYLSGRANLARVYVLVDARHGLKPTDSSTFEILDRTAISYQIILTKTDTVKATDLATRIDELKAALATHPAAFPNILLTSAHEGTGIPLARAAIAQLFSERRRASSTVGAPPPAT